MSTIGRIQRTSSSLPAAASTAGGAAVAAATVSVSQDAHLHESPALPDSIATPAKLSYRSIGLGVYAVGVRFTTMPLEKIAMIMNSSQVSGSGQLGQAWRITFCNGLLTPFGTVGRASIIAWFFQYSVMGFVFQLCDRALSTALNAPTVPYGPELMKSSAGAAAAPIDPATATKVMGKAALAPVLAGVIESAVANRAEAQRFYGVDRFAKIERKLGWNVLRRQCGPAFAANASRNAVMSATSFVVTPTLYRTYFPQEKKSQSSLFWYARARGRCTPQCKATLLGTIPQKPLLRTTTTPWEHSCSLPLACLLLACLLLACLCLPRAAWLASCRPPS